MAKPVLFISYDYQRLQEMCRYVNGPPFLTKHLEMCIWNSSKSMHTDLPMFKTWDSQRWQWRHQRASAEPTTENGIFFAGNPTWKNKGRNYIIQRKTIHSYTKISSDWNWHHVLFHHSIHINSTMHRKKYAFPTSPNNGTSRRKATISAFPGNDNGHDSPWLFRVQIWNMEVEICPLSWGWRRMSWWWMMTTKDVWWIRTNDWMMITAWWYS